MNSKGGVIGRGKIKIGISVLLLAFVAGGSWLLFDGNRSIAQTLDSPCQPPAQGQDEQNLTVVLDKYVLNVGESTTVRVYFDPTNFTPEGPVWFLSPPAVGFEQGEFTVSPVAQTGTEWTGTLTAGQKAGQALITLKATNIPDTVSTQAAKLVTSLPPPQEGQGEIINYSPGELSVTPNPASGRSYEIISLQATGTARNPGDSLIGLLSVDVSDPYSAALYSIDYQDETHAILQFQLSNFGTEVITVFGQVSTPVFNPAYFTITIQPLPRLPIVPLKNDQQPYPEPPVYNIQEDIGGTLAPTSRLTSPNWFARLLKFTSRSAQAQTTSYGCVTLVVNVKEQATQAPLEGAKVSLTNTDGYYYPTQTTNASGRAGFNDVVIFVKEGTTEPVPYTLKVTYTHPENQTTYTATKELIIPTDKAGQQIEETVELNIPQPQDRPCNENTPQTIKGTVKDKAGNSLKDAMIVFGDWNHLAFTGADGTYTINEVEPNFSYGLIVFRADATLVETIDPDLVEELTCTENNEPHIIDIKEI